MALILFDTNIFIDMLNGVHQATIELGSYDSVGISFITYMELRSGDHTRPHERAILAAVLEDFQVFHMDEHIMETSITIRGTSLAVKPAIKLPDAIIGATAALHATAIVTRNPKDFTLTGVAVRIPYDYDSRTGLVTNIRPPLDQEPRPTLTRTR